MEMQENLLRVVWVVACGSVEVAKFALPFPTLAAPGRPVSALCWHTGWPRPCLL